MSEQPSQLDRIEASLINFKQETRDELRGIKGHLREQNSKIATLHQTAYGPPNGKGLVHDVDALKATLGSRPVPGTVQTRTLIAGIAAATGIVAVLVTLIIRVG